MKLQIALLSTLIASALTAQAKTTSVVRVFETKNHKVEQHIPQGVLSGEIQVNYGLKTVQMTLQPSMPACPVGMFCAQVMPQPMVVELPIVSIQRDNCGILEVTALRDRRPVDGQLRKIKLYDASNVTCMFFVAYVQKATYETQYYSRVDGKEVVALSTMDIQLKETVAPVAREFTFAEGKLVSGYPKLEKIGGGNLVLTDSEVELNLYIRLNCAPTQPCPKYMPAPIQAKMKITNIEKSSCGDTITAVQTSQDEYGTLVQEIKVSDMTQAICEIYIPHPVRMTYTETYTSKDGLKDVNQSEASFDFAK